MYFTFFLYTVFLFFHFFFRNIKTYTNYTKR